MPSKRRGPDGLTDFERDICHAVDEGMGDREAYRAVRPDAAASDGTAERYVWRVRRRPQCRAYLAALRARSLARHENRRERIVEELASIAFADIGAMLTAGPDGPTVESLAGLPPEQRRAIARVTVTPTARGNRVRFATHSKLAALDKLCRLFGLYAQDGDEETQDPSEIVAAMSDVERAQRLAAILFNGGLDTAGNPLPGRGAAGGADGAEPQTGADRPRLSPPAA